MKRNIAFFGSPEFSATILEKLIINSDMLGISVAVVFTQPDRPVGRKGILTSTPVRQIAERYKLPVVTSLNDLEAVTESLKACDLAILYAYAEIIGEKVLAAPKNGFWNIHPSLLPKYRGASPTAYPLIMGDKGTGVSLMIMDAKLDHGPLLGQKMYQVSPTDTKKNLEEKLTNLSYELIAENLQIISDNLKPRNQDHKSATFTRKLTKNDGYISREFINLALHSNPEIPAQYPSILLEYRSKNSTTLPQEKRPAGEILYDYWRAMDDWPGIWTKIHINGVEKRLKITKVSYDHSSASLSIDAVQLEGKNEVDFKTFQKAYGFSTGL